MNRNFLKILFFLFITINFGSGCFLDPKENMNNISDKKFFLSEFQFVLKGQDKEGAYKFFKEFPIKKIMFMLAKEYNITIDITDYNNFINTKNLENIGTDGFIRVVKHTWMKKDPEKNRIIMIFEQDYFDASQIKFKLGVYRESATLKIFNTEVTKTDSIIKELQRDLAGGKESLKEFEDKNYDKVSPIPNIIDSNITEKPVELDVI